VSERDLTTHPYSADEKRVGEWLDARTGSAIGWGDDPIGWMIASYEWVIHERTIYLGWLRRLAEDGNADARKALDEALRG
jgi:hypothetical protein